MLPGFRTWRHDKWPLPGSIDKPSGGPGDGFLPGTTHSIESSCPFFQERSRPEGGIVFSGASGWLQVGLSG
jgi:hypothetical protein